MKTNRTQPLAATLPPGLLEAGFNADPRQLLLCKTEVYGLISGPSWLRQSLIVNFEALGYIRNPYDKCIPTLAAQGFAKTTHGCATNHQNVGVVLIEVDDIRRGWYSGAS